MHQMVTQRQNYVLKTEIFEPIKQAVRFYNYEITWS
jgi:hypothetical protein